jgi:hypothetical protein
MIAIRNRPVNTRGNLTTYQKVQRGIREGEIVSIKIVADRKDAAMLFIDYDK